MMTEVVAPTTFTVWVPGEPVPQGSMKAFVVKGRARVTSDNPRTSTWREDVRSAVVDAMRAERRQPWHGTPLVVRLDFVMKRPLSTPKRRTPPAIKKPDLDKLERAMLDAIGSAGLWDDDARVVELHGSKRLAELGESPGVAIAVTDTSVEQHAAAPQRYTATVRGNTLR